MTWDGRSRRGVNSVGQALCRAGCKPECLRISILKLLVNYWSIWRRGWHFHQCFWDNAAALWWWNSVSSLRVAAPRGSACVNVVHLTVNILPSLSSSVCSLTQLPALLPRRVISISRWPVFDEAGFKSLDKSVAGSAHLKNPCTDWERRD